MEKYSGIHDEKLTRVVSTFCIIALYATHRLQLLTIFMFRKYLNTRTEIFKQLNSSNIRTIVQIQTF